MPRPSYTISKVISDAEKVGLRYVSGYRFVTVKCLYACSKNSCGWVGQKNPVDVRKGSGCVRCANKEKYTEEKLQVFANKQGLSYVSGFVTSKHKAKYKCNNSDCGWIGEKTPDCVLTSGCPRCAGKERLSIDRLNGDATRVGLQYVEGFVTVDSKATYICCNCGETIKKKVDNVIQGQGCPYCCKYGFSPSKPATFYIYLIEDYIGYGITNNFRKRDMAHKRMFRKCNVHFDLMRTFDIVDGLLAQQIESKIKKPYDSVSKLVGFSTESANIEHLEDIISFIEGVVATNKL